MKLGLRFGSDGGSQTLLKVCGNPVAEFTCVPCLTYDWRLAQVHEPAIHLWGLKQVAPRAVLTRALSHPLASVASRNRALDSGPTSLASAIRSKSGTGHRTHAGLSLGRVGAAPGSRRRGDRFARLKRQPPIEDRDLRPRDCVPMHARVRAYSRSTAEQTATTAVGLEPGSSDGLDGTIGFDGEQSCAAAGRRDRFATHWSVSAREG